MKSKKITFVNILSLLGMAMLAFATFMGAMFTTGGSMGISISVAAVSVMLLWTIRAGAIYAKEVDTNFSKWKKVEISLAILFWIVALLPGVYSSHFISVLTRGDEIRTAAKADVENLDAMFANYENFERNAIANTRFGLENALGQPCDAPLSNYMRDASIRNIADIDSWIATQRGLLLGREGKDGFSYLDFRTATDSVSHGWLDKISSGDYFYMATHAGDISGITEEVASRLTENSSLAKLPGVEFGNGLYSAHPIEQCTQITAAQTQFDELLGGKTASAIGYLVTALMLLLIFSDYIFAHRSNKMQLRNFSNDSGDSNSYGAEL